MTGELNVAKLEFQRAETFRKAAEEKDKSIVRLKLLLALAVAAFLTLCLMVGLVYWGRVTSDCSFSFQREK